MLFNAETERSHAKYFLRELKDQIARLEAALTYEHVSHPIDKAHDIVFQAMRIEAHLVKFETLKDLANKL